MRKVGAEERRGTEASDLVDVHGIVRGTGEDHLEEAGVLGDDGGAAASEGEGNDRRGGDVGSRGARLRVGGEHTGSEGDDWGTEGERRGVGEVAGAELLPGRTVVGQLEVRRRFEDDEAKAAGVVRAAMKREQGRAHL
jgi:hypothetical protein